MRTRRYLSVCLTATGLFITSLQAQEKKDLSFGQIFKGEASGLSQPLPAIRGWADDTHYIEMRSDAKAWKVDAQTGNATPYEKAPDGASVTVVQNDIIYTSDEGV